MPIYFVRAGRSGPIKIGVSAAVDVRLADLQVCNAEELFLLGTVAGTSKDETELHKRFSADHIRGEWFHSSVTLLKFIESINGGTLPKPIRALDPSFSKLEKYVIKYVRKCGGRAPYEHVIEAVGLDRRTDGAIETLISCGKIRKGFDQNNSEWLELIQK